MNSSNKSIKTSTKKNKGKSKKSLRELLAKKLSRPYFEGMDDDVKEVEQKLTESKKAEKECAEGQVRGEKGRCKKVKTMKDCPEGQMRGEKGRCKKVKTLKECPEGQMRGEKGRCRKIKPEKTRRRKNKSTGSMKSKYSSFSNASMSEGLNEEQQKEFDEIISKLKQGQLRKSGIFDKASPKRDPSKELTVANCFKMFDDVALKNELDKRGREKEKEEKEKQAEKPVINILIPRKKVAKV